MISIKLLYLISNSMDVIAVILVSPAILGPERLIKLQLFLMNLSNKGLYLLGNWRKTLDSSFTIKVIKSLSPVERKLHVKYFIIQSIVLLTPILLILWWITRRYQIPFWLPAKQPSIIQLCGYIIFVLFILSWFTVMYLIETSLVRLMRYLQFAQVANAMLFVGVATFLIARIVSYIAILK